ncbi:MAG TPA: hypothetical protein VGG97_25195, partial [Bryobacteraceae bacterium]
RPTGEIDSRAKLLLVSSLVLISLCLATEKPDSINVLGFTFKAREWLVLGIPLTLVVIYAAVQLYLAWSVQRSKMEHAIFTPILSIRTWIQTMMTARIENGAKFIEETLEMSRCRADIEQWFKAQSDAVFQQNTSDLKQPEAIWDEEVFTRNRQRWEDLQTEHEKRRKDAGLTDHEKKVDAVLDDIAAGRQMPDFVLAADALKDWERVIGVRKVRALLDLIIPLFVAFIALYVFTITVISPSYLSALGSYLSKGR